MIDEVCIQCGGTGITFLNEKCECGAIGEKEKLCPRDLLIPKLYQTVDKLGDTVIVRNVNTLNIEGIIDKYTEEPKRHPSMILDISSTDLGAYQVYYYIISKLIDKYGKIPYGLQDFIIVNKITENNLTKLENSTREGDWKPLIFITDYPIDKEEYNGKAKLIPFKGYNSINPYPINLYTVRFINQP